MELLASSTRRDPTPLQELFGFQVAEQIYDSLDFRDQIIVDLKLAGWSQEDIGELLGLTQGWVSIIFKGIRYKVANVTMLRQGLKLESSELTFERESHATTPDTQQVGQ